MNPQIQVIGLLIAPLATLAIVVVGFLYNNSRITDLRSHLDSRIDDLRDTLRAETKAALAQILASIEKLDHRISTIESERRILR